MVMKVSGVDFDVRYTGRRLGDPPSVIADNRRIRAALGWSPEYDDIQQIIRHAFGWESGMLATRAA
jgi:UDP-glucose 4-epimerase